METMEEKKGEDIKVNVVKIKDQWENLTQLESRQQNEWKQ
jgi:hypothetical protein